MVDSKVKLKKVSCLKIAYIFSLFGIFLGLLLGLAAFIFLRLSVLSLNMDVGFSGIVLLGFLAVPICVILISFIIGLLFGLFFNFFLRVIHGLDIILEEIVHE